MRAPCSEYVGFGLALFWLTVCALSRRRSATPCHPLLWPARPSLPHEAEVDEALGRGRGGDAGGDEGAAEEGCGGSGVVARTAAQAAQVRPRIGVKERVEPDDPVG